MTTNAIDHATKVLAALKAEVITFFFGGPEVRT